MNPVFGIAIASVVTCTAVACFVPWLTNRLVASRQRTRIEAERDRLLRQQQHELQQSLHEQRLDSYTSLLEVDDRFTALSHIEVTEEQIVAFHQEYLAQLGTAQILGSSGVYDAIHALLQCSLDASKAVKWRTAMRGAFGPQGVGVEEHARVRETRAVHAAARKALVDLMRADLTFDSGSAQVLQKLSGSVKASDTDNELDARN